MKLAIVTIPFILGEHHRLLAEQSLSSVKSRHTLDRIAIVNALRDGDSDKRWLEGNFDAIEIRSRNNVAAAWNRGIALALERGARFVLVMNLDLFLHAECIDNLIDFAEQHQNALLWSASTCADVNLLDEKAHNNAPTRGASGSLFLVDHRLFEQIGKFDETFNPAYHEDSDMFYRIHLAGSVVLTAPHARFYHVERGVIKGLAVEHRIEELQRLSEQIAKNFERYIQKWGGKPGQEVFKTPYNA